MERLEYKSPVKPAIRSTSSSRLWEHLYSQNSVAAYGLTPTPYYEPTDKEGLISYNQDNEIVKRVTPSLSRLGFIGIGKEPEDGSE